MGWWYMDEACLLLTMLESKGTMPVWAAYVVASVAVAVVVAVVVEEVYLCFWNSQQSGIDLPCSLRRL
jgi:hypothetical protein